MRLPICSNKRLRSYAPLFLRAQDKHLRATLSLSISQGYGIGFYMGTGSRFNTGDDFGVLTDTGYSACIDLQNGKVEGTLNRAPFQYAVERESIPYADATCTGTPQARSEPTRNSVLRRFCYQRLKRGGPGATRLRRGTSTRIRRATDVTSMTAGGERMLLLFRWPVPISGNHAYFNSPRTCRRLILYWSRMHESSGTRFSSPNRLPPTMGLARLCRELSIHENASRAPTLMRIVVVNNQVRDLQQPQRRWPRLRDRSRAPGKNPAPVPADPFDVDILADVPKGMTTKRA